MHKLALAPILAVEPKGMPDIRRLAQHVVDSMPRVQAAILFGSRARKTARRNSDWDVALLVPDRYKDQVLSIVPRVPTVSYLPISPKRLQERHNRLGTLERSVAEDGIVLAGEWNMSNSKKRAVVSYPALFRFLNSSIRRTKSAYYQLADGMKYRSEEKDNDLFGYLQDAAEFTSKAALLHMGVHPPKTHDVEKLSQALRERHPNHVWVTTILSFNGNSAERHVAGYEVENVGDIDECEERMRMLLEFHDDLIKDFAKRRPGFHKSMVKLCKEITSFVSDSKTERKWKRCSKSVRESLLLWEQNAAKLLEECAGKG